MPELFVEISVFFIYCVIVLSLVKLKANIFIVVHIISLYIFIHLINNIYSHNSGVHYEFSKYIQANLVFIIYSLSILIFCIYNQFNSDIVNRFYVSRRIVLFLFSFWLIEKIAKNFVFKQKIDLAGLFVEQSPQLRNTTAGSGSFYIFESIDTIFTTIGVGIFLYLIIKSVRMRGNGRLEISEYIMMFVIGGSIVILNSSGVGSRRALLILVLFYIILRLYHSHDVKRSLLLIVLAVPTMYMISQYYQSIRWNVYDYNVQRQINSDEFSDNVSGLFDLLTPNYETSIANSDLVNRGGPLDLSYGIIRVSEHHQLRSNGLLLAHSLEVSVPRFLHPNKPLYDVDNLLADMLGPFRRDIVKWNTAYVYRAQDFSSSPPLYLFVDFGYAGSVLSALIFILSIFIVKSLYIRVPDNSPFIILIYGYLFQLMGTMEGRIQDPFLVVRDLSIFYILYFGTTFLFPKMINQIDSKQMGV